MAIVYQHTRLDNNSIFYIGISVNYKRAYDKSKRNKIWKGITSRTTYKVDIIYENLSWEEACEKEKELIKIYGRLDNNTGILANLTDGGEGTLEYKHNSNSKHKIGLSWKGKIRGCQTDEHKRKMVDTKKSNNTLFGWHKGIPRSEETKEKIRQKLLDREYICPHCGKKGVNSVMFRWHFNNCKNKSYE